MRSASYLPTRGSKRALSLPAPYIRQCLWVRGKTWYHSMRLISKRCSFIYQECSYPGRWFFGRLFQDFDHLRTVCCEGRFWTLLAHSISASRTDLPDLLSPTKSKQGWGSFYIVSLEATQRRSATIGPTYEYKIARSRTNNSISYIKP